MTRMREKKRKFQNRKKAENTGKKAEKAGKRRNFFHVIFEPFLRMNCGF